MKHTKLTFLLAVLMSIASTKAFAFMIDGLSYQFVGNKAIVYYLDRSLDSSWYNLKKQYSGNVVIPECVIYDDESYIVSGISEHAFSRCFDLTSITIPSSVTSIGNYAFEWCKSLTTVTIPNNVANIGDCAFMGCYGLTSINVNNENTKYDSRNNCNAIIETATNTLIAGCKNTAIPNDVTSIGDYSFYSCKFNYVEIPSSVTTIGNYAFSGCEVNYFEIPNSVTSIGNYAFRECHRLTSVTIPKNMMSIGSSAFFWCDHLTDVFCYAENIPITAPDSFAGIYSATLHVPADVLEVYKTTAPWSGFGTIVAIEDDEVTATDVSAMSYAVYAQPAKARKGSQTTLSVCMKNTQPITLWQADLMLPAGFTIATDSYGDPMVSISGGRTSTSRHSISTSTLSDGSIRILCSSSSNKTFTGTDGEVATITLNVASNVNDGDYAVKFNNIKLVEANETKHEVDEVVSVITVKSYTLGDVNDDGSLDGADLVGIVNYILDRPTSGNIFEAADVNQDGVIDGSDYVREVNAILGKIVLSARRKAQRAEAPEADYAVYANDFEGVAGKQTTLHLNMKNDQPVTLWQADLVLPEGVSIATDDFDDPMVSITGGRTTEARHAIATNTLPDGSIRILCSSSSNKTFTGNDGEVATITLNINKDMESGKYPVALKNILIVEADETRHSCDYEECMLDVTRSTGISSLLSFPEEDGQVYNIAGQRLSKPQRGINIQNGKKVLR